MKCSVCKNIGHNKRTCIHNEECPICYEKINDKKNIAITSCGHKFCCKCLVKSCSRNGECPICRHKIFEDFIIKSFLSNQDRIMKRSLDNFEIVERFPRIIDDEKYKEKLINDLLTFSNLVIFYSLEEMMV